MLYRHDPATVLKQFELSACLLWLLASTCHVQAHGPDWGVLFASLSAVQAYRRVCRTWQDVRLLPERKMPHMRSCCVRSLLWTVCCCRIHNINWKDTVTGRTATPECTSASGSMTASWLCSCYLWPPEQYCTRLVWTDHTSKQHSITHCAVHCCCCGFAMHISCKQCMH